MSASNQVVMILEPSRLLRQAASQACIRLGAQVRIVPEVGKALSLIGKSKPTAIITAMELPGLCGGSLIAALRACMHHRAIPIALLTANEARAREQLYFKPDAIIRKESNLATAVAEFLTAFGVGLHRDRTESSGTRKLLSANILLAEDSTMVHRLISRFLHVAGAEVVVVEDGVQAVEVASEHPFDLVLMDIEMPRMNGLEAARILRERGIEVPIIATTAHSGDSFRLEAESAGFDDVITKPIDAETIVAKCAEHLQRSRAQLEAVGGG